QGESESQRVESRSTVVQEEEPATHRPTGVNDNVCETDLLCIAEYRRGRHAGLRCQAEFRHRHNVRLAKQDRFKPVMPGGHRDVTINIQANGTWPRRRQYL